MHIVSNVQSHLDYTGWQCHSFVTHYCVEDQFECQEQQYEENCKAHRAVGNGTGL